MLIDVHGHVGRFGKDRTRTLSAAETIVRMNAWGIDKTCLLPLSEHPEGWYLKSSTEDIIAACAEFPARLIPFCLIDPRFGDNSPDTDFRHLLAEYRERGCVGMGEFLPNLWFDDPRCLNLYRQCGEFDMPVLFDMKDGVPRTYGVADDPGLPRLENALKACPDTIFIGHGPAFWADISGDSASNVRNGYPAGPVTPGGGVSRLLEEYPNMYADISAGSGYNGLTRDEPFGQEFLVRFQDKLLFGLDVTSRDATQEDFPHIPYLNRLREAGTLAPEAWEKIAHLNAERLLRL